LIGTVIYRVEQTIAIAVGRQRATLIAGGTGLIGAKISRVLYPIPIAITTPCPGTTLIVGGTGLIGAIVSRIGHTITIAIAAGDRTTLIARRTGLVGTVVLRIKDAIAIAIARAGGTSLIVGTPRLRGTVVLAIQHPITILIAGTRCWTTLIRDCAGLIGATVLCIENAIAIAILRAHLRTALILARAELVRAIITIIRDTIAITIGVGILDRADAGRGGAIRHCLVERLDEEGVIAGGAGGPIPCRAERWRRAGHFADELSIHRETQEHHRRWRRGFGKDDNGRADRHGIALPWRKDLNGWHCRQPIAACEFRDEHADHNEHTAQQNQTHNDYEPVAVSHRSPLLFDGA